MRKKSLVIRKKKIEKKKKVSKKTFRKYNPNLFSSFFKTQRWDKHMSCYRCSAVKNEVFLNNLVKKFSVNENLNK